MSHTKKQMNPILKKELRLGSRSIKLPLALMFYNIVLSFIAVIAIFSISTVNGSSYYSGGSATDFSGFLYIFQIIGWTQLAITLLIVPILSAGSISGEREKQTLEIMLTTPEKPLSIVWGKLLASLSNFIMFIISSIPIMAISFVLGGLNWFALLGFVFMILVVAVLVGSIGVFCSSVFKKTIISIVMTFLIEGFMLVMPIIIFFGCILIGEIGYGVVEEQMNTVLDRHYGPLTCILQLTPLTGFFDYMLRAMDISSIAEILKDGDVFGKIVPILSHAWIPVNVIISGLISYFFLAMAAKKLNPIKKRKKKKVTRQMEMQNLQGGQAMPQPQKYQPQVQMPPQPMYAPPAQQTPPMMSGQTPPVQQTPQMASGQTPPVQQTPPMMSGQTPPVQQTPQMMSGQTPLVQQTPQMMSGQTPPVQQTPPMMSGQTPPAQQTPPMMSGQTPPQG